MAWGSLAPLIWGCLLLQSRPQAFGAQSCSLSGARGRCLPDAGRTTVTLKIRFCGIEEIILWGWRNTVAASAQHWQELIFLAKKSSWRQRERVPAMPTGTSEGNGVITSSHLPPNYCNVPKKQLWELCTSLVPVLAVTVTPSLQLWWFPVPWLYTVPSSGGFLCMSASQVVPHCWKHLETELWCMSCAAVLTKSPGLCPFWKVFTQENTDANGN